MLFRSLISLSIHNIFKVHPCCCMCQNSFLFKTMIFHRIDGPHCVYPLIHRRTLELLPLLGYHEQCCYEHGWTNISSRHLISIHLGIYPEVELLDHMIMIVLCLIFWELPCCFPQCLHHFTFPLTLHKSSILGNTFYFLSFFWSFCLSFIVAVLMGVRCCALLLFKLLSKAWCLSVTI